MAQRTISPSMFTGILGLSPCIPPRELGYFGLTWREQIFPKMIYDAASTCIPPWKNGGESRIWLVDLKRHQFNVLMFSSQTLPLINKKFFLTWNCKKKHWFQRSRQMNQAPLLTFLKQKISQFLNNALPLT